MGERIGSFFDKVFENLMVVIGIVLTGMIAAALISYPMKALIYLAGTTVDGLLE